MARPRPRGYVNSDACLGRDSNPHGSRRGILSALCLPIPPPRRGDRHETGDPSPAKISRGPAAVYGLPRPPAASAASRRRRMFSATLARAL